MKLNACILTLLLLMISSVTGAEPLADSAPVVPAGKREVIVSVMAWSSPLGYLNGSRWWQKDRYRYQRDKNSNGINNYPTTLSFDPPEKEVAVGSDEFYRLQFLGALDDQKLMKSANFDVVAYDMLPMPFYNPREPLSPSNEPLCFYLVYKEWLKAAEQTGMKVAPFPDGQNRSGDFPQGHTLTSDEWITSLGGAIDNIPDSPAVWRVDGKKALLHFGTWKALPGEMTAQGEWATKVVPALRKNREPFFFVADVKIHRENPADWRYVGDAVYDFSPAAPRIWLDTQQERYHRESPVPYVWISSPGYYNTGVKAFTQPDFERIHESYINAMKAGARWMNVLTWNDFGEDTDIVPSANKGHVLLDVYGFYNQWFKSGKQPPADDKMVIAYPLFVIDKIKTPVVAWGPKLSWRAPGHQPRLIFWSNSKKARSLTVDGVGSVYLPKGIAMGTIGLVKPGVLNATVDGTAVTLPSVKRIDEEGSAGGLQFRYVDVSALIERAPVKGN